MLAALAEKKKEDALLFLNDKIEALAYLFGQGSLAFKLAKELLNGMQQCEPDVGAVSNTRITFVPAIEVNFSMYSNFL